MAEYIERGALIADIGETVIFTVREGATLPNAEMRGANKVIDRIKSASAADVVEVRHGEWEITKKVLTSSNPYIDDDYYIRVECSECGFRVQETRGGYGYAKPITTNYCPNCGAKMDGKGEGE